MHKEVGKLVLPIPRPMTIATSQVQGVSKGVREAIVDKLRSCQNKDQVLAFEAEFNEKANAGPLYLLICEFLHDRTISRAIAAKWLKTILDDRETKLNAYMKHL